MKEKGTDVFDDLLKFKNKEKEATVVEEEVAEETNETEDKDIYAEVTVDEDAINSVNAKIMKDIENIDYDLDDDDDYDEVDEEKVKENEKLYEKIVVANQIDETLSLKEHKLESVDINKIKINKQPTSLDLDDAFALLKGKSETTSSTVTVVAIASGYSCKVKSLTNADSFKILNTRSTLLENNMALYRTIYSKIVEFSCGHMDFRTWIQRTALADLESFYYGLYCATFVGEGTFDYHCGNNKCGEVSKQTIKNGTLISNENIALLRQKEELVSKESTSIEAMEKISVVGLNEHLACSNGVILEVSVPTVYSLLELYNNLKQDVFEKTNTASLEILLHISAALLPNTNGFVATKKPNDILSIVNLLKIEDANYIKSYIEKEISKNNTSYSLKEVTCPKCGHIVNSIPINLSNMLFTMISKIK